VPQQDFETGQGTITRRDFVGQTLCGGGAAGLGACCAPLAVFAQGFSADEVPKPGGYLRKEIGAGLHWVSDGAYSTMFLVSSEGVIACDAPPTLGHNYLNAIAEVTDKPVRYLVYSHEHVDHIAGARVFPSGVEIVAHRLTAELLASRRDESRPLPTKVFDESLTLSLGDQSLELRYHGINHSFDNIFIFAPRQKALMLIDVIYPGWMPYKNLGVAVDIPGFVAAHRQALSYDFETLVAGHVTRPGTREDVETQLELIRDLFDAAERAYGALTVPQFLAANPPSATRTAWDLHNDYEQALVSRMVSEVGPKWRSRLRGTDTYLRDNCWAMLETFVVQGKPAFGA
jgi:glyoxylase-like metal-dependent hydrolase (beta-lactamase superfamily II)